MSKTVLMIVGVLAVLVGIVGLVPSWTIASMPAWLAVVEIVIGLISIYVSAMDKGKA